MLIILNDPSGITGGQKFQLDYSISLQKNIERHMSGGGGCELLINGQRVDPLADQRLDVSPGPSDLVTVIRRPEGWETAYYIVMLALVVYTYTNMPKMPGQDDAGKDSPNNKLTTQSNVARAYQGLPDVYGFRRVWPDLIQPSTVEYIDNLKYVTEWLCISRGSGDIADVKYAETPVDDIEGSSYEIFAPVVGEDGYPESGTTTINDVFETFASDEVNGQEIPYYPQIARRGDMHAIDTEVTFTVTIPDGTDLDAVKSLAPTGQARVRVSSIAGFVVAIDADCTVLSYVDGGSTVTFTFSSAAWVGSTDWINYDVLITPINSSVGLTGPFTMPIECSRLWWSTNFLRGLQGSVTIRAEWWQVDADGVEISGTREQQDDTYAAASYNQHFYTTKVTPSSGVGRYRVEFTRLTPQIGDGGADVAKLEEVYAVRHHATKVLPGATIFRVTTKATLSATGFSDRKFNLFWHRHVRTLEDDTLSASRNFARILAHIWTIAGNDIAGLDTAALLLINGEHGEDSEVLRFDGSLDDADMSLGERMQLVANMARCIIWRDGTKWTVTRDQAKSYPDMQFDYRNLAASGESVINYAAHLPASNDGVEIEYVDEVTQAKKAYIRLDIRTGAPVVGVSNNPKKVKLPGCTTQSQAMNRAQVEARRLIYQRTSVTDTALADANGLGIGAVVRWIDPNDFAGDEGLQAGEVMSVTGDLITTSEPVDWKGETSGRIVLTGEDGRYLGAPIVCYPSGSAIQLASVPTGLYVASATRQLGSRYAFGVGLSEAEMEASGLYITTEIRPAADGTVSLALAQYDDRIYSED